MEKKWKIKKFGTDCAKQNCKWIICHAFMLKRLIKKHFMTSTAQCTCDFEQILLSVLRDIHVQPATYHAFWPPILNIHYSCMSTWFTDIMADGTQGTIYLKINLTSSTWHNSKHSRLDHTAYGQFKQYLNWFSIAILISLFPYMTSTPSNFNAGCHAIWNCGIIKSVCCHLLHSFWHIDYL